MICVSLMETSQVGLELQIQRNLLFSSFFEFRLTENTLELLPWLLRKERSYRCIITIRNVDFINMSLSRKMSIYEESLRLGAEFVDWDENFTFPNGDNSRILYSFHHFERTFSLVELIKKYEEMKRPQGWVKLVFWANRFLDNLIIRDFLKQVQDPQLVSFCMGDQGQISRILACCWGSAWTYASANLENKTAKGQLTAEEMSSVYRINLWKEIPSSIYGVLGNPVAHSLSPLLHNEAFFQKKISAIYLPVMTENPFEVIESSFFEGLSITLPFKQTFLEVSRVEVSELGRKIQAINTLVKRGDLYFGDNTDFPAALKCLSKKIPNISGKRIVIWGSGGMAWSLALGFAECGADLYIQSRNLVAGRKLASSVHGKFIEWGVPILEPVVLLVQTTPVGMWPNIENIPASLDLFLGGLEFVFETIYRPEETVLVSQARKRRIGVILGMDLFLNQAFLQQQCWTGSGFPREDWAHLIESVFFYQKI